MGELATKRSAGAASAEIEGEPTNREVRGSSPVTLDGRDRSVTGIGVDGNSGESARPELSWEVKGPSTPKRPVLRVLTGGRGMGSVHRRRNETGFPSPALPSPMLLLVVGGHYATEP